jgi:hypothetical protein
MGIGAWALIPTVILAAVPYLLIKRERWWPGAFGWALVIVSSGVGVADYFRAWGPVALAGIFFGVVLGFAGVLNGPNSPAN